MSGDVMLQGKAGKKIPKAKKNYPEMNYVNQLNQNNRKLVTILPTPETNLQAQNKQEKKILLLFQMLFFEIKLNNFTRGKGNFLHSIRFMNNL